MTDVLFLLSVHEHSASVWGWKGIETCGLNEQIMETCLFTFVREWDVKINASLVNSFWIWNGIQQLLISSRASRLTEETISLALTDVPARLKLIMNIVVQVSWHISLSQKKSMARTLQKQQHHSYTLVAAWKTIHEDFCWVLRGAGWWLLSLCELGWWLPSLLCHCGKLTSCFF